MTLLVTPEFINELGLINISISLRLGVCAKIPDEITCEPPRSFTRVPIRWGAAGSAALKIIALCLLASTHCAGLVDASAH